MNEEERIKIRYDKIHDYLKIRDISNEMELERRDKKPITIKELIEKLNKYPEDTNVYISPMYSYIYCPCERYDNNLPFIEYYPITDDEYNITYNKPIKGPDDFITDQPPGLYFGDFWCTDTNL